MKRSVPPRRLPSPALVLACTALAVALGGVGYAAVTLPRNSVGTVQLKSGAVVSSKVKDHTLKKADVAPGVLDAPVRAYAGAPEYGVVQLYFSAAPVPDAILTSPDIPDDGNLTTVAGTLSFVVPDGTTAQSVALKAGIRSGEKDGTGSANPAGHAGLVAMEVSIVGAPGTTSVGGGNPGAPNLPLGSAGNATLGGDPLYPIALKAPRSAPDPFAFPDDRMIELTDPSSLQVLTGAPGRFTVTNTSGAPALAVVRVTVRFQDRSVSATDLQQ